MSAGFLPQSPGIERCIGPGGAVIKLMVAIMLLAWTASGAMAFKFSEADDGGAEDAARRERISELVSVPCKSRLKNQKIMVVIAERTGSGYSTAQSRYSPHFQAINQRLRDLG